ncbi:MAG: hypothetical protein LBC52_01215 [Treponema sp.]|jgi:hypothetical protein|nr:hypothetical protein [Treponema sp.]
MKKERIMAIIGIVLSVICLINMFSTYDSVSGKLVSTLLPLGAFPYPESLQNQIWAKILFIIFVLFFYQLFYYITYLNEGVKSRIKSFVVLSIIGLVLNIGLLISGIGETGVYFLLINILYLIIFSIVMFVRSLIVMLIRFFRRNNRLPVDI